MKDNEVKKMIADMLAADQDESFRTGIDVLNLGTNKPYFSMPQAGAEAQSVGVSLEFARRLVEALGAVKRSSRTNTTNPRRAADQGFSYALRPAAGRFDALLVRHYSGGELREIDEHMPARQLLDDVWDFLQAHPDLANPPCSEPKPEEPFKLKAAAMPQPYPNQAPLLKVGHTALGAEQISITDLGNTICYGESGVGKTTVHMVPLLRAAIQFQADGLASSLLLIDPKAELLSVASAAVQASGREQDLLVIGKNAPKLCAFDAKDGRSLLERLEEARLLIGDASLNSGGDSASWDLKSLSWVAAMLELNQAFAAISPQRTLFERLLGKSAVPHEKLWGQLLRLMRQADNSHGLRELSKQIDTMMLALPPHAQARNPIRTYSEMDASMGLEQLMYVLRGASKWVRPMCDIEATGLVDLDPFANAESGHFLDLQACCDTGKVVVFQPGTTLAHDVIARLLKVQFFKAVTTRQVLKRPQFYVVDEFQRFITTDESTGEHAFLDRCRAYRCNAVLATQSLAALTKVASNVSAQAIMANCRTKVFMRCGEASTQHALASNLPYPRIPTLPHISTVRPLASLQVGQSYYVTNQGWGLSQYHLPKAA